MLRGESTTRGHLQLKAVKKTISKRIIYVLISAMTLEKQLVTAILYIGRYTHILCKGVIASSDTRARLERRRINE